MDLIKRVARDSVIGGIASQLGGGKFKNGAATAAFARLFNDEIKHGADDATEEGKADRSDQNAKVGKWTAERLLDLRSDIGEIWKMTKGALAGVVSRLGGFTVNAGIAALDPDAPPGVTAAIVRKNYEMCRYAGSCLGETDLDRLQGYLSQAPPNIPAIERYFSSEKWQIRTDLASLTRNLNGAAR
jgi:hypothetical protein